MIFKRNLALSLIVLFLSFVTLFYQLQPLEQHSNKPYVVCTTSIIEDIVVNLGKDLVRIDTLMGPGVDPHLYKPVENDIIKIATSDIIFYNGLHLEARMTDLFKNLQGQRLTVAVTQDIPLDKLIQSSEYDGTYDPHVWFDISLWSSAVETVYQTLINYDSKNQKAYENNKIIYLKKLSNLLDETKKLMESVPQSKRVLITGHDAFSYFGRLYNYQVIGLQGINTESNPCTQDVQNLIHFICTKEIPAIFIESSIPVKNIHALQEGVMAQGKQVNLGGELFSDALGPKMSEGETYITMIQHNSKTIAQALKGH